MNYKRTLCIITLLVISIFIMGQAVPSCTEQSLFLQDATQTLTGDDEPTGTVDLNAQIDETLSVIVANSPFDLYVTITNQGDIEVEGGAVSWWAYDGNGDTVDSGDLSSLGNIAAGSSTSFVVSSIIVTTGVTFSIFHPDDATGSNDLDVYTIVGADTDGDGIPDDYDICPAGDDGIDADLDDVPDACDVCPGYDDGIDLDGNLIPDGCDLPQLAAPPQTPTPAVELDSDGDGIADSVDTDDDNDLVLDTTDNCPVTYNPDQDDFDGDGIGAFCDPCDDPDGVDTSTSYKIISNGVEVGVDSCYDSDTVIEQYCNGDVPASQNIACAALEKCENGICVFEAIQLEVACLDPDDGSGDIFESNSATKGGNTLPDMCSANTDLLYEAICTEDETLGFDPYDCSDSNMFCEDGACVTCTDDDGGLNYIMKGTVESMGSSPGTDYCSGTTHVVEFFCNNGELDNELYYCQNGCDEGRCILARAISLS